MLRVLLIAEYVSHSAEIVMRQLTPRIKTTDSNVIRSHKLNHNVEGDCEKMRKSFKNTFALSFIASTVFGMLAVTTHAQNIERRQFLSADLSPLDEVPAKASEAHGNFAAEFSQDGSLSFKLTFSGLSSPTTQAHIHFGATKTNGGVMVFLCGGPKPSCPAEGSVSGTITAADVSVLPANNPDSVIPQGVDPGNFGALAEAILSGTSYVNVHTKDFPTGEIRGQIKVR